MKNLEWKKFKAAGLLWWINRQLHLFGWTIVMEEDTTGEIANVYPLRVAYRGFNEATEEENFINLTQHIADTAPDLLKDVKE